MTSRINRLDGNSLDDMPRTFTSDVVLKCTYFGDTLIHNKKTLRTVGPFIIVSPLAEISVSTGAF